MKFEWDENKRRINLRKHGLDFANAHQAFNDDAFVIIDDREDYGEERYILLSLMHERIVVIAYTVRGDTIRIASSQCAKPTKGREKVMPREDLEQIKNTVEEEPDEDINYSDIPPLSEAQLSRMRPLREVLPQAIPQVRITLRLDADTVQWFKEEVQQSTGETYQNLINEALRYYIERRRKPLEEV
jgi:uncharacterized protein